VENSIKPFDSLIGRIDRLPLASHWKIALRTITGAVPATVGSLILERGAAIMTLFALLSMFIAARPFQEELFQLTPGQRFTIGAIMQGHLLAWAFALNLSGQAEQIARTTGAIALASAVALWPIYVSKTAYQKKLRRVPFATAYGMLVCLLGLQQISILMGAK
jgi:hypothetical protein